MDKISALMDGELERAEAVQLIPAVRQRAEWRETWATYHLIGDALRGEACSDCSVAGSVAQQLTKEPTILAPRRLPAEFGRRWALPSIAAAAAVASVTWMSLETQQGAGVPSFSQMIVPALATQAPNALSEFTQVVNLPVAAIAPQIQLPVRAFDAYLMAHQEFSPSTTLQGLAPYVRTVTSGAVETGR